MAEWVSLKEMEALQGACMLTSLRARERQYEELLSDLDNLVWKELSDGWQNICWKKKKAPPCEPMLCPESFQNKLNEFPAENIGIKEVLHH